MLVGLVVNSYLLTYIKQHWLYASFFGSALGLLDELPALRSIVK